MSASTHTQMVAIIQLWQHNFPKSSERIRMWWKCGSKSSQMRVNFVRMAQQNRLSGRTASIPTGKWIPKDRNHLSLARNKSVNYKRTVQFSDCSCADCEDACFASNTPMSFCVILPICSTHWSSITNVLIHLSNDCSQLHVRTPQSL